MTSTASATPAQGGVQLALFALLLGNFATGLAVLAPAGMITVLAKDLGVSIREAGFLVTAGAIMLCIGSPVMAWVTTRVDRRTLLSAVLLITAICHGLSALAPNFWTLLAARVAMLAAAAVYTPQAANAVALLVAPEKRASSISFVFLGWSLAVAAGLPGISLGTQYFGWREVHAACGVVTFLAAMLNYISLRPGLLGEPLSLQSWLEVARNPLMLLLLAITTLQTSGQFALLTYLDPLTRMRTGGGAELIALLFSLFGICGFVGNVIAAKLAGRIGPLKTSIIFMCSLLVGIVFWALDSTIMATIFASVAFWGLGFAAFNSMQQARLVAAGTHLSSATVALNTSALYVGQAIGSALGGLLFARGLYSGIGYLSTAFVLAALLLILPTRDRS
ncbi:MAG: MFS transporter [Xanthobacteraceae bacterium]|nr:MFS transporter [Xanthobacteraceae bacterium]